MRWLMKTCKPARAIDHRGVGIAIAIEIRPGKLAQMPEIPAKGMNRQERAVAIIAQNCGQSVRCAQHDVEIAIGLDVHRPRAGVRRIESRTSATWSAAVTSVNAPGLSWRNKRTPPAPGKHQIGLEVVVEVDRQNAFRRRRDCSTLPGKRKCRASGQTHFPAVRFGHDRRAFATQRNGSDPVPAPVASIRPAAQASNVIAMSAGAGLKTGDSMRRK